ncbi:hypothetical protein BofuT4_uP130490.1 [Botrytis cinerea T4]|uniref:Uncharacterized protein n=1 Tax=Botryotinia fuckeliana (strain T4) TaxID=999810 RepID=G2YQH1_BOTF4|nr:hypothetical protein BofuT4_uP130490.1 [Botrytis cinerea T4]
MRISLESKLNGMVLSEELHLKDLPLTMMSPDPILHQFEIHALKNSAPSNLLKTAN